MIAKQITTSLEWENLIVEETVKNGLAEILHWLEHSDLILNEWDLKKHLKPGFRALFYGAPGTGKSLAAKLIGKKANVPVYRVDLSLLSSSYIGETEENLGKIFDEAADKKWILFFDEADALFGKRTEVNDAHDRYANQEVSYLLQRIEDFNGLIILATNVSTQIDDAFSRRFQQMIHFPKPAARERELLWKYLFQNKHWDTSEIDFHELASNYELTGGELIHILRHCAMQLAQRGDDTNKLKLADVMAGIKKEYKKHNKTI